VLSAIPLLFFRGGSPDSHSDALRSPQTHETGFKCPLGHGRREKCLQRLSGGLARRSPAPAGYGRYRNYGTAPRAPAKPNRTGLAAPRSVGGRRPSVLQRCGGLGACPRTVPAALKALPEPCRYGSLLLERLCIAKSRVHTPNHAGHVSPKAEETK
jgi:hypothetical protein